MPRTSDKREKLVAAAGSLVHQHGYRDTSIADIAESSGVPLGNIYYYFKTKDDLVSAVINHRRERNQQWCNEVENLHPPKERLLQYLRETRGSIEVMTANGCPVGSLCQELDKSKTAVAGEIDALLKEHIDWVTDQFVQMGQSDGKSLGLQYVSRLQGAILVANALKDSSVIAYEMDRLENWIDDM